MSTNIAITNEKDSLLLAQKIENPVDREKDELNIILFPRKYKGGELSVLGLHYGNPIDFDNIILINGINEKGLAAVTTSEDGYSKAFLYYLLSNFSSTEEIVDNLDTFIKVEDREQWIIILQDSSGNIIALDNFMKLHNINPYSINQDELACVQKAFSLLGSSVELEDSFIINSSNLLYYFVLSNKLSSIDYKELPKDLPYINVYPIGNHLPSYYLQ